MNHPATNSVTVGELIAELQQMPQDAVVIYSSCSEYAELMPGEATFVRAEEKKIIWREQGGYMDYRASWFDQGLNGVFKGETPKFVTVCCFPGN